MKVQVISFNCVVKNKSGGLLSSTQNRNVINSVDEEPKAILKGLTRGLQQLKKGEKRQLTLSADEAFGAYEPAKVIFYPKNKLTKPVRVGENISITGKSGTIRTYLVAKLHEDLVSLDGNHPLAGQDLIFEIEALEARDATPEDIGKSVNLASSQFLSI